MCVSFLQVVESNQLKAAQNYFVTDDRESRPEDAQWAGPVFFSPFFQQEVDIELQEIKI